MKQFLAVFMGSLNSASANSWNALDDKARAEREKAGMDAWGAWAQAHQKAIVSMGAPLGKTKKADPSGLNDIKNAMTAYTIVQAANHDEAAKIFLNHPHFMIFPGDSIEIMECLPMPG